MPIKKSKLSELAPLSYRITPQVKAALEKAAKRDSRSVSGMAQKIIEDWLRAEGFLKAILVLAAASFFVCMGSAQAYDCYDGKSDDCTLEYSQAHKFKCPAGKVANGDSCIPRTRKNAQDCPKDGPCVPRDALDSTRNRVSIDPKLAEPYSCGAIVGAGWDKMPDVADYIKALPNGDKLGFGSECHLGSLVFAQCFLEPRWSVKDAIDELIHKAIIGNPLPDTPVCGA